MKTLNDQYKDTHVFGYVALKEFVKFEDGRMVTYGYSIKYDMNDQEVGRTKPQKLTSLGWGDESPFTELDLYNIKNKIPRRDDIWKRLKLTWKRIIF